MKVSQFIVFLIVFSSTPLYGKPAKHSARQLPSQSEAVPKPPLWVEQAFGAIRASRQSLYMIVTIPKVSNQSEAGKTVLKKIPASLGQAFLVGKNLLLSANHITADCEIGESVWVWNKRNITFGKIVYQHPTVDFVLIETDLPDGVPLLLAVEEHYEEAIVFVANLYQLSVTPNNLQFIAKIVRLRNEIPMLIGDQSRERAPSGYLVFEGVFKPGDSGAPIFNEQGYVIGMLTMIGKNKEEDAEGNGAAMGVPSRVLLKVYKDYLAEKEKKSAPSENFK